MLNKIWCFFIIIAIIFGIVTGTFEQVNQSIFNSMKQTVELIISLFGSICFWNGIMNMVKNTTLISRINRLMKPLMKLLFPEIKENSECYENISMNMTSNLLGLGNSSTPSGLKAIEELQKKNSNKDKLTNHQILLILINTASIQIIPTTMIGIRSSLNSKNASAIIIGVWFSSFLTFFSMVSIAKIYLKYRKY